MDDEQVAPLAGIVGCVGVVLSLGYPYLTGESAGVGAYYGTTAVNPLVAGLLALVTVVVLAAGRQRRSDPSLAAGVGLALGVAMVAVALLWGFTVRVDAIAVAESHRWVVAAFAGLVPLSSLWYARALGLL
jgi:hypothetical protein